MSESIKVIYIVSTLRRTGPTNQLRNIIKFLDREKFDPYLITLSEEPADSLISDFRALKLPIYQINLSRLAGVFFAKCKVEKIIDAIKPDLVHTQGFRADSLSARMKSNVAKIATIRNFPQYDYTMTYGNIQGRFMAGQHSRAMRNLDLCVGVSDAVAENLNLQFSLDNICSIANGVDTEVYYPVDKGKKLELRRSLNLEEGRDIWISSGHLSERKDPLLLISSWKANFGEDTSKQLVLIGDGPLKQECEKKIIGCSNVKLLGHVDNVSDYLRASDYYISTSRAEGMPNAVLEALACGLPVLLSSIPPHQEIFDRDPKVGSLFTIQNPDSLSKGFVDLLSVSLETRVLAANCLIDNFFSAKRNSSLYQKAYIELIGEG